MTVQDTIGVDVSKDHLDACHASSKDYRRLSNDATGLAELCEWASGQDRATVVFEGETGRN